MSEPLVYEFHMTPEFARAAIPMLEQALWVQNERLHQYLDARMRFRSRLPSVGVVLSACGLPLALLGWFLAPRNRLLFAAFFAVFLVLLFAFLYISSIARALRRFARRMVAFRASKMMEQVARRAPYTIQYQLADHMLMTRVGKIGFSRTLDLRSMRLAVGTTDFLCVFPRSLAQTPARVLYVPGPQEHAALSAALAATGTQILQLPYG